jgi:MoaA/NifB/PqqE/SkfB family radical SAM enzyme
MVAIGHTLYNTVADGYRVGNFLTFVVPAPQGCDLKCPSCLIRQRGEICGDLLKPGDYARFIHEAYRSGPIFALSVQGYEPLLPASRPYTQAVLATGRLLKLPTALVTNGTHLREAAGWLAVLEPDTIAVSLDAALPEEHDRIRGVSGAWASTVEGIRRAVQVLPSRTELAVASVLTAHSEPLLGMPALLRSLGIKHWIITPLQRVGKDQPGGPTGNRDKLYRNLQTLHKAALQADLRLSIDDELNCLQHELAVTRHPELTKLPVRTLPRGVDIFRLAPGGECSMNHDILRKVSPNTPRWCPGEMDAGNFIENLASVVAKASAA